MARVSFKMYLLFFFSKRYGIFKSFPMPVGHKLHHKHIKRTLDFLDPCTNPTWQNKDNFSLQVNKQVSITLQGFNAYSLFVFHSATDFCNPTRSSVDISRRETPHVLLSHHQSGRSQKLPPSRRRQMSFPRCVSRLVFNKSIPSREKKKRITQGMYESMIFLLEYGLVPWRVPIQRNVQWFAIPEPINQTNDNSNFTCMYIKIDSLFAKLQRTTNMPSTTKVVLRWSLASKNMQLISPKIEMVSEILSPINVPTTLMVSLVCGLDFKVQR